MKISYDNKIKKKLVDNATIKKCYGKLADKIIIRMSLLVAANSLADIPNLPPTRRHKLVGNYASCWGIEIEKNWRIVVKPILPNLNDPEDIKEIIIVDIVDYH